jgi:DNA-binding response OmpR family regulator
MPSRRDQRARLGPAGNGPAPPAPVHPAEPPAIRVGPLEVVPEGFEARLDGRQLTLSAAEFRLLAALAAAGGAVVRFEQLLLALRGRATSEPPRVLHPFVSRVRRAMGPAGQAIEAVPRVGYRLEATRLDPEGKASHAAK